MSTLPQNLKPFIITAPKGVTPSIEVFEGPLSLIDRVQEIASKHNLELTTQDTKDLQAIEDFLNTEAADIDGQSIVYSVYENLDAYVADMCSSFSNARETVEDLKKLHSYGFDLLSFFNIEELQEFASEEGVSKEDVDYLYEICGVVR